MKIQDAAREQGIHLSKEQAIRLQQLAQQEADQTKEVDLTKKGEESEKNGEGQQSDFSIASTARAFGNPFFEPIAHGAERLLENTKNSLTSTAHAIIRSASVLSVKLPELQGEP
jgi:hypothetical protein